MRRDPRRARFVLALLLLTAFTFLTVDVRSGRDGVLHGVRSGLSHVFSPVGRAVSSAWRPVGDAFSAAFHAERDRKSRDALEKEVIALKRTVASQQQQATDKGAIDALRDLEFRGKYSIVAAQVIGVGTPVDDFQQIRTINAGAIDHVTVGDRVVTGDGLVGKVVGVQAQQSQIALITDDSFIQGVQQVDNSDETQLQEVQGQGEGQLLRFTLTDTRITLKKGVRLVTYPDGVAEGIPVGVVDTITSTSNGLAQTALVRPYAHLDSLDVVGVVLTQERGGPRSALQASPSPTPPPSPSPSPGSTPSPGSSPASGGATTSHTPVTPVTPHSSAPPPVVNSPSPTVRRSPSPATSRTSAAAKTSPAGP